MVYVKLLEKLFDHLTIFEQTTYVQLNCKWYIAIHETFCVPKLNFCYYIAILGTIWQLENELSVELYKY